MASLRTALCLALLGLVTSSGPYGAQDPHSTYSDQRPYGTYGDQRPYSGYADQKPYSGYGDQKPYNSYGDQKPYSDYGDQKPYGTYGGQRPSSGYGVPKPSSGYGVPKPSSGYGVPKPSSGYGAPRVSPAGASSDLSSGFGPSSPSHFQAFPTKRGQGESKYYISWLHDERQYTRLDAAKQCEDRGLKLISLTSAEKEHEIQDFIRRAPFKVEFYWTSGEKAPNGRFVWSDGSNVCYPNSGCYENWGRTGGDGKNQPDNRDKDENCLAVLNTFYPGDGITWHDIACHHEKYFVCE